MAEVRLLGTFTALGPQDRSVDLGRGRCRDLLARLAIAGGRSVHRELLCEDLWAGAPPATAVNKLQGHVSALRGLLGRGAVRTTGHAYALAADVQVDLVAWRAGVRRGLALADEGDDTAAMAALSLAAGQWTGEPLSGLGAMPFVEAERRALEELHLEGAERRAELRLRHGYVAAVVADLGELVERYPLHEGLVAQLVLGTAMSGRQVEALLLHDRARARLADGFGLEPGPKLRAAQQQVLRGGPVAVPVAPARPAVRLGLPHLPAPIVGRRDELVMLESLVADPQLRLITLTGLGGVGKTRLAQALVEQRPRTACWATLTGVRRVVDAPEAIAAQLGIAATAGDSMGQLISALAAAAVPPLLVLDGLDHLAGADALVERILLGAPGLTVLATSRRPLGLAAERRVVVGVLPVGADESDGAVRLLLAQAGRDDAPDLEAAARIAELCGGLPLALELAAARARVLPLAELRDRLAWSTAVLGGGSRSAVDTAVESSAALLPGAARRSWVAASVFVDGFAPAALAAVLGQDLSAVLDDCEQMLDLGLLRTRDGRAASRLELQPVVRDHAEALLDAGERRALEAAHAAHFAALVVSTPGLAALAPERANLRAAVRHLRSRSDDGTLAAMLAPLASVWCAVGDGAEMAAWIDEVLERDVLAAGVRADLLLARMRALGQDPGQTDAGAEEGSPLALADALLAAGEPDEAAQVCLAALAETHAEDRHMRCRLLVRIAAARLLDGRVGLAADAERAALRLIASSTWTREKLTLLLVSAAHLTWRGGRAEDAAYLTGLAAAGVEAIAARERPVEAGLRRRYLHRLSGDAATARAVQERAAGQRAVTDAGVHAAVEDAVQGLLDDRALRPATTGRAYPPARSSSRAGPVVSSAASS